MKKAGFTLIELLVVIAIIAILASILFPVFAKAREKARQSSCLSNLKQMGLATMSYLQDYDESYPGHTGGATAADDWPAMLIPYMKNAQIIQCPSAKPAPTHMVISGYGLCYGYNCYYLGNKSQAAMEDSSGTLMLADDQGDNRIGPDFTVRDARTSGCIHCLLARHNEMLNCTFVDGHAKAMKLSTIDGNDAAWFNPAVM